MTQLCQRMFTRRCAGRQPRDTEKFLDNHTVYDKSGEGVGKGVLPQPLLSPSNAAKNLFLRNRRIYLAFVVTLSR
jgi:hypothetical protein